MSELWDVKGREGSDVRHEVLAHARLLGDFSMTTPAGADLAPRGRKARCILVVLLLSPSRGASRNRLMSLLWSDRGKEQARGSLRQALKEIRQALGPLSETLLDADREHVRLFADQIRCDVHALLANGGEEGLWQGPLMEGLGSVDPAFDDWLRTERERCHDRWLKYLERRLESASAERLPKEILDAAVAVIEFDQANEGAHRAAIRAHAALGEVPAALRQFAKLEEALTRTLQVKPSAETVALVERIRQGAPAAAPDVRAAASQSGSPATPAPDLFPQPSDPATLRRIEALRPGVAGSDAAIAPPANDRGARRRLAAICFVDVVGYSRAMERDEMGTHLRWMAVRADVIEPCVEANAGRVVKGTGDGLLLEFESALDVVEFALDLQRKLLPGPASRTDGDPVEVRISAHMGDIIPEDDDVYGDGVNVAARLLPFADPGGIVISATVHDQVHKALQFHEADMGFLTLKNIERRVRAFKIAPVEKAAPAAPGPHTYRPSIAVLPLRSLGMDPPERYFSEGVVHDIVSCLASIHELFVVSSSSTLALADSNMDTNSVCHMLGVRYLLTGSIARSERRWRIHVELSDTDSRSVIWTDRYEFGDLELFNVQETIAMKVVYALLPHIRSTELHRAVLKPPESLDAHDYLLRGIYSLYRLGEEDFEIAHQQLRKALEHDPSYALANAMMAKWYILQIGEGRSDDVMADSQAALRHATQALQENPSDPLALAVYGHTQSFLFARYDRAIEVFDLAISTSPNSEIAWGLSAPTYCYIGEGELAIERAEHALALSPLEPFAYFYRTALTLAHYFNGTYEESVFWGMKTMAAAPRFTANMRPLIASLSALGRMDEARAVAEELIKQDPDFSVSRFTEWYPLKEKSQRKVLAHRLLRAGLPE